MVQTVFAPEGEINLEQLWKEITPDQLMDSKLKCVFELPVDQDETAEDTTKFSPKVGAAPPVSSLESELKKEVSFFFLTLYIFFTICFIFLCSSLYLQTAICQYIYIYAYFFRYNK